MTNHNIGDSVRVNKTTFYPEREGKEGTIISFSNDGNPLVSFPGWKGGHAGNGYVDNVDKLRKDCWFFQPKHLDNLSAEAPAPLRSFKKGSQNAMLLKHLISGRTITRIEADHMYRIASLTRRIRDLRVAGYPITSLVKSDPHGSPYTEYALQQRDRFGNKKVA
jgi:hypothetical protein